MVDTPARHAAPEEETAVDPVVDESPVLAPVAPQYATDTDYDLSGMPETKPIGNLLPSARFSLKRKAMEIADLVPEEMRDADEVQEGDMGMVRTMEEVIASAEDFVLEQAKDREAMANWLIAQKDGEQAVMAAFKSLAERLGN